MRGEKMPPHSKLPAWVKEGDIVISRIGGRVFRYEGEGQKLPRNSIFIQVKPSYRDKFDQNALGYYIEQNVGNWDFLPLQGSVQQAIRVNDLRKLPITGNTDIQTQRKWANGIEALNDAKNAAQDMADKYDMMKSGLKRRRIDYKKLDWYEMQDNRELMRRMLIHKNVKPNPYVDRWLQNTPGFNQNFTFEEMQELANVLGELQNDPRGLLSEGAEMTQFEVAKETNNLVPLGFTNTDNDLEYTLYQMGRYKNGKPYYLYEVNDPSIKNLDEMRETPDTIIEVDDEMLLESMTDPFSPIQNTYFRRIEKMKYEPAIYRNGYSHQYAIEMKEMNPQLEFRTAVIYDYDEADDSEIEKVEYVWLRDPKTNQIFSADGNYKNENELKNAIGFSKRAFIETVDESWLNRRLLTNKLKPLITDDWESSGMPADAETIEEIDDPVFFAGDLDFDEFIGWEVDETDYDEDYGLSPLLDERIVALCCGQPTTTCSCPKRAYPFTLTESMKKAKPLKGNMRVGNMPIKTYNKDRRFTTKRSDFPNFNTKINSTYRKFDGKRFIIEDRYRNKKIAREIAQEWRNREKMNARVVENADGTATVYVAPSDYRRKMAGKRYWQYDNSTNQWRMRF